jgi:hypothetical protein
MATFETRISHTRDLTFSPFSSEQMTMIGDVALKSIQDRMHRAVDITDGPAKPLFDPYAARKLKRGLFPVRDWSYSGGLQRSLKVIRANEDHVELGPTDSRADKILTGRRGDNMWPASPKDWEKIQAEVRDSLTRNSSIQIRWVDVA